MQTQYHLCFSNNFTLPYVKDPDCFLTVLSVFHCRLGSNNNNNLHITKAPPSIQVLHQNLSTTSTPRCLSVPLSASGCPKVTLQWYHSSSSRVQEARLSLFSLTSYSRSFSHGCLHLQLQSKDRQIQHQIS